jgi:deazaflavin-dependent oxidoreductase (nitroreductase family)
LFKIADIFTGRYTLIRYISKLHLFILTNFKNKYLNELIGIPVLILITIGRKSNKKRYAPLVYFQIDDSLLIVASNGGNPKNPNWYQNLISQETVHININGKVNECNYSIIENKLRDYFWTEILKIYPKYNEYQNLSGRTIPIVKLKQIIV